MPPRGPMKMRPPGPVPNRCKMVAEQGHELGVDGRGPGFSGRAVLELAALAGEPVVGPAGAAAGLGMGQQHLAPPLVGKVEQVAAAQVDGFLGAQSRVVQAAEERDHPLAARPRAGDGGEEPAGLVGVSHRTLVHGLQRPRPGLLDGLQRVGGQRVHLDGVLHRVGQDHALAVGGVGGGGGPVLLLADPVQDRAGQRRAGSRFCRDRTGCRRGSA